MQVSQTTSYKAKAFANYLLNIGNGTKPTTKNNLIHLPNKIVIYLQSNKNSINILIDAVYYNLAKNATNTIFITKKAILILLNSDVEELNKQIITKYLKESHMYYNFNLVPEDDLNLYHIEYLNSLTPQGLSLYKLAQQFALQLCYLETLILLMDSLTEQSLYIRNFKYKQSMQKLQQVTIKKNVYLFLKSLFYYLKI
ncbi:9805_t:CDS:1 [Cetraspora pellucida]|uniref:9805_t:CDS:1 n=1 Tax=Cetraspora pellucida TaxID=1433469 RepID=A0ACA9MJN1_9GLOM|nr:9805_t:CDS:1 [Cetraspora pellucida]